MSAVVVQNLKRYFRVSQKDSGLLGTIRSIFNPKINVVRAVDDVSFKIDEGELVGFIGPNGAGKTTTLKMLSGVLYPTRGDVQVLGRVPWKREEEFLKNITLVMGQRNQLWWELPPIDSFLLNRAIYGISQKEFKETLEELLALLEVEKLVATPVRNLSLGQRMRMELVAALLHKPRVLFLDEPTIGLDLVAAEKIREFVERHNKKNGATVLLTSHYMGDIERLAERIIVIDKGAIIFDGKLRKLLERYGKEKAMKIVFSDPPNMEKLGKAGEIVSYNFPRAEIHVPRTSVANVASQILQEFNVADLTIEEPPIEEIIRGIFESGRT